jgi:PilZ domain
VLFFKRILNFSEEPAKPSDLRQAPRHVVGPTFPFKAVVTLPAYDGEGNVIVGHNSGQDWAGRLTNLSATGGSIQLSTAAAGRSSEPCLFKLSLDTYALEIPSRVAHFRNYPQYALCGFAFNFPNFEVQKAFLQVLEPVAIGSSLSPVDQKTVLQDLPGLRKEQFSGHAGSVLTIWRQAASNEIHGFDLRMSAFGVRWSQGLPALDTYGFTQPPTPPGKKAVPPPPEFHKLTEAQQEEVHWLFCLAVPNLAKAVPVDVRKFLGNLVAT